MMIRFLNIENKLNRIESVQDQLTEQFEKMFEMLQQIADNHKSTPSSAIISSTSTISSSSQNRNQLDQEHEQMICNMEKIFIQKIDKLLISGLYCTSNIRTYSQLKKIRSVTNN